jgi:hypothetical protein
MPNLAVNVCAFDASDLIVNYAARVPKDLAGVGEALPLKKNKRLKD